jgi:hypothetical protein
LRGTSSARVARLDPAVNDPHLIGVVGRSRKHPAVPARRRVLARLVPLLILLALIAVLAVAWRGARPRSDRVYRPRASPFGRRSAAAGDADWVASRAELAGVRDAYSSETIDPDRVLYRCGGCLAWYHDASVAALKRDNAGRCAACGSADVRPAHVA